LSQFEQGYSDTRNVQLTIVSVQGSTVHVVLSGTHTDGSVHPYHGYYVVRNGHIVYSYILHGA